MTNREQIDFWNGPRGESWVADQPLRDRSLAPFGDAALALARASRGERVVDVGCGCGATSLALAEAVGPAGSVLGVDLSGPMLARARERGRALPQLRFEQVDAATFAFDGQATLLYSRFGVMFFDDPPSAFENLRRALSPGGRIAFACWRGLPENDWLSVPLQAVRAVVAQASAQLAPDAPGPLAFADPTRVRGILEGAGFDDISLTPVDREMPLGEGRGVDAAAAEAITLGPAARLLLGVDDATRVRALAAVASALAPLERGGAVRLSASAWVVSARRADG